MDNYCKEFQYIDPLQSYKPWVKNEACNKDMIMPANERQIAAAFVCSDPIDWGRDLQVSKPFQILLNFTTNSLHLVTPTFYSH